MEKPIEYCALLTDYCLPMQDWSVYWSAAGVLSALLFGFFGLYKIYHELKQLNQQRAADAVAHERAEKLKRTEFFLDQHRRIFDDPQLYEVLCLIDSDDALLAEKSMWDKKRKLMAFFEELALLIRSRQINKQVALYMFGYYAVCAKNGPNFGEGIALSKEYWGLFFEFADEAIQYLSENRDGPPQDMSL